MKNRPHTLTGLVLAVLLALVPSLAQASGPRAYRVPPEHAASWSALGFDLIGAETGVSTARRTATARGPSGSSTLACTDRNKRRLELLTVDDQGPGVPTCAQPRTYTWWRAMSDAQLTCLGRRVVDLDEAWERYAGPTFPPEDWELSARPYVPQREQVARWGGDLVAAIGLDDLDLMGGELNDAVRIVARYLATTGSAETITTREIFRLAANLVVLRFEQRFCQVDDYTAKRRLDSFLKVVERGPVMPVWGASPESPDDDRTCPTDALLYVPGPFVPTPGSDETERLRRRVELTQDVKRLEVTMTVRRGPWSADKPRGNHNLLWLHRIGEGGGLRWKPDLIGYVNVFGRGANNGLLKLTVTDGERHRNKSRRVPFGAGGVYTVRYVFDLVAGTAAASVLGPDGAEEVEEVVDGLALPVLVAGDDLQLVIGHVAGDAAHGGPEVPTHGWGYSDVCVRAGAVP